MRSIEHLGSARRFAFGVAVVSMFASGPANAGGGSAPNATDLRLPADIVYASRVAADSAVVFRHDTHVAMARNQCTGCHPRPFHMLRPTRLASHREMNAGGSCGTCHDGQRAFGVSDTSSCATCHTGRAAAATNESTATKVVARALPRTYVFTGSSSPGPVAFQHETHRGRGCTACHPDRFPMKPPKLRGLPMHQSQACGACHDGKGAFSVEDIESCDRCHHEGAKR